MNVPKLRFSEFDDEWINKNLNEISSINPKNDSLPDEFIYIDLESVKSGILSQEKIIVKEEAPSRAQRTVKQNDILFQTVRPYQQNNYFVNEIKEKSYVASTGYALIRTSENPYFVYSLLHKKSFLDEVLDRCTGTSFPAISSNDLGTIEISIPTIDEQNKIAITLKLLDKKLELQFKKIEDLKLYTKKILKDIISNKNYEYKRLDEIFDIHAGGDIKKENVSETKSDVFPYPIYSNNLDNDGLYGFSNIFKVDKDAITVTGRGDIGKAKYRKSYFYPIVRLLFLIPKVSVNLLFYQEVINNIKIIQESTGVPQLTAPQISKYKVIFPKVEVQNNIGMMIGKIEKKIELETEKLNKLEELKKGLMQSMFV